MANARPALRVAVLATAVDFGGIEKVLLTLARHVDRDVELIPLIFTRRDGRSAPFLDQLAALGASARILYVDRSRLKYLNPIRNIVEAVRVLRRERFDLIHSHGYRADLIASLVSTYFGVPVVSTCHGFTPNDRRLAFYSKLNVFMLRRFDRVVAVSARMRDDLVEQGLRHDRIAVVPNAVEQGSSSDLRLAREQIRARLGFGQNDFVFGYVGRLSEEKGVHHLLDALALRPTTGAAWRLLLVGDGPRRRELEAAAGASGSASSAAFVGFQADPQPWYAAMDAFVLPSLTEGTPVALLEAMARRLPVIATAVGGVPAIVTDRVNGLLVPPSDAHRLSKAMEDVSSNGQLRQTLAAGALDTVNKDYDVGTWVSRMRGVYEQELRRPRRQS